MKKGFTLIELLVVVLIIGILAAIALPQYRLAVAKAKAAELLQNMRALKTSADDYRLANGSWPRKMDDMLISIPNVSYFDDGGNNYVEGGGIIDSKGNKYAIDIDGYITAISPNMSGFNIMSWLRPQTDVLWKGNMLCRACNELSKKICVALGGALNGVQSITGCDIYAI